MLTGSPSVNPLALATPMSMMLMPAPVSRMKSRRVPPAQTGSSTWLPESSIGTRTGTGPRGSARGALQMTDPRCAVRVTGRKARPRMPRVRAGVYIENMAKVSNTARTSVSQRDGGIGLPVVEPRQIRALVSPARQDILDAVTAIGPCSVSELASALGRPADGLYYHIKALMRARLLTGVEGEAKGLQLDVVNRGFHLKYQPGSVANRTAVLRAVGAMVRSSERTFRHAYRPGTAVVSGARRNLW